MEIGDWQRARILGRDGALGLALLEDLDWQFSWGLGVVGEKILGCFYWRYMNLKEMEVLEL